MRDDQGNGNGQRPEDDGSGLNAFRGDQQPGQEPGQHREPWEPRTDPEPTDAGPYNVPSTDSPAPGQPGVPSSEPSFGQPSFGQPSFGRPNFGQPSFGEPSFGQPSHNLPGYGQPSFGAGQPGQPGQPGYPPPPGAPGYGQPAFGPTLPIGYASAYGQPGYAPPPTAASRRRRNLLTYLIVAIVAAAAGAGVTAYFVGDGTSNSATGPQASGGTGGAGGNNGFPNFPTFPNGNAGGNSGTGVRSATERAVINAVRPGLVDISSNLRYQGSQAAATGMVISSNGLVLTNNHVITDTTQLYATVVSTNQKFSARWLGYDATNDVAVIKLVGARNLRTVPLGDSSAVKIGDSVVAMGNADGAGGVTPATGRITGLDKTINASDSSQATTETLRGMLQTNAGIVQGDSGGALANTSGRVIGMNTAAATGNFGVRDIGFAIPINKALAIAHKIIHGQGSKTIQIGSTGFMGVLVPAGQASQPSNPQLQRQRQLQEDQNNQGFPQPALPACLPNDLSAGVPSNVAPVASGALVIGELCGTPANKAHIVPGDVITAVGRHRVTSPADLTKVMMTFKPGDTVRVTWVDIHGQIHHSPLTLIEAPPH